MSRHLQRAELLMGQSRHDQALDELRQHLANDPDNPLVHSLMALCFAESKQYQEATEAAEQGIHLGPDQPFTHFALARVQFMRDRLQEAEKTIQHTLALNPHDENAHALQAAIFFQQGRWKEALQSANAGLAIDPEDGTCNNLRAMSLVKLGKRAEAGQTIGASLARDPDNPLTHANQGWTLLEQNEPRKAMEHFREALRLDPNLEWARLGIVEALKARNLIYRGMLNYFLWMSKLTPRAQWGIILGGYFGMRILRNVSIQFPAAAPYLIPFIVVYAAFALMTWIADPLFNLLLRFDSFGKLTLSREEIVAANWLAVCLGGIVAGLLWYAATGASTGWLAAGASGLLMIPVSAVSKCSAGWPRRIMAGYTILLALLAIFALFPVVLVGLLVPVLVVAPGIAKSLPDLLQACGMIFLFGTIASGWVANALITYRPSR